MCIRNKNLSFILNTDFPEQVGNSFLIKFFKYIIQQQERGKAFFLFQPVHFSQFKRKEQAFPLPLRRDTFEGLGAQLYFQVIPVYAGIGAL